MNVNERERCVNVPNVHFKRSFGSCELPAYYIFLNLFNLIQKKLDAVYF